MAKKRNSDDSTLISGLSDAAKAKAQQSAQELLRSGKNTIELEVAGGRLCIFELVRIPHDQINNRTVVAKENKRVQRLLNPIGCADILATIKDKGQQYPAIGQYIENNLISTIEGSRRRFSCRFAQKDFLIYVTKEQLTSEDISYLSDVGNVSRPISLYEQGLNFNDLLASGVYDSPTALAKGENIDPAIVSIARKAANLPADIINHLPSIDALGRPSINELSKFLTDKTSKQLNKIIEVATTFKVDSQMESSGNGKVLNQNFLQSLYASIPRKTTSKKRPVLAQKGKTTVELSSNTKTGFSLKFSEVQENKKEQLLEEIKKLITRI